MSRSKSYLKQGLINVDSVTDRKRSCNTLMTKVIKIHYICLFGIMFENC